tara:strand:- start:667 stop:906 length:240 start_codon:yes stop_codon:yes gene_type:complete
MVLEMILATDLKSHFDYINRWSLLFPKRIQKSPEGMNGALTVRSKVLNGQGKNANSGDDADNHEQKLRKLLSSNVSNST